MTDETVILESGDARLEVALRGAEPRRWTVGGKDLLWSGDPAFWGEIAPVLFPVVGWTRNGEARVAGRTYPLGLHGFARAHRFAVTAQASDRSSVELVLVENDETLALYPFPFRLAITMGLKGEGTRSTLTMTARVTNTGDGPMPYSLGFHPGFLWPLPGATGEPHAVVFERAEQQSVPVIAPGGLLTEDRRPVPLDGTVLPVDDALFSREALCFIDAKSRALSFGPLAAGGPRLRIDFKELPSIVLWSRPGAGFLCIEGWAGTGDPVDFVGDLFEKPGMRVLAPGESGTHELRAEIEDVEGDSTP